MNNLTANKNIHYCLIRRDPDKDTTKEQRLAWKRPFEKDWVNIFHTWEDVVKWRPHEINNYGVLTGHGLVVLDADTDELAQYLLNKDINTFTVKTTKGYHFYLFCDWPNKVILQKDGEHYGELQSTGQQVVGPGSTHPSGAKYEIYLDVPIKELSSEELYKLIKPYWQDKEKKEKKALHDLNKRVRSKDINSINISDVIPMSDFVSDGKGEYNGANPWHGSTNGRNMSINPSKNVAFCRRCNVGINVAQAIALEHGIVTSCDAQMDKQDFIEVLKIAQRHYGLEIEHTEEVYWETKKQEFPNFDFDLFAYNLRSPKNHRECIEQLVNYVLKTNHIYTERDDDRPNIWIYNNGIYIPNGKSRIKEQIEKIIGKYYTPGIVYQTIERVMNQTYIDPDKFFNMGEQHVNQICLQNGILNIKTMELIPFNPKLVFFNKINASYNINAACPNIIKHLRTVLASEKDFHIMQELLGYLLYKKHPFEKAFMFSGEGRNGKGKTIELMKHFINPDNCVSIPLQQLEKDPFAVAELHHKMANLAGDLDPTALKHTGVFKNLTGQDNISAQRKYKTRITFKSYAKMIFAANELPEIYDQSLGMKSRWILIDFPYTFITKDEYAQLPIHEKKMHRIKDPFIVEKLKSTSELDGLLLFALDGLHRLLENNQFTVNKSSEDTAKLWSRKANTFLAFFDDIMEEDFNYFITLSDLNTAYTNYCRMFSLKKAKKVKQKEILLQKNATEDLRSIDDVRQRVMVGIKFKDKYCSTTQMNTGECLSRLNHLKLNEMD